MLIVRQEEFQCLEGYMNSNVWKDKIINTMFGRIRPEFQSLKG